jgi:hypothetical protein
MKSSDTKKSNNGRRPKDAPADMPVTPANLGEVKPEQLLAALQLAIQPTQILVVTLDPGNAAGNVNPFTMAGFASNGAALNGAQMKALAQQALESAVLIERKEQDMAVETAAKRALEKTPALDKEAAIPPAKEVLDLPMQGE